MESANSEIAPYGASIRRMRHDLHQLYKTKIFDYVTIFKLLDVKYQNEKNPIFSKLPYRLPALKYVIDSSGVFDDIYWEKFPYLKHIEYRRVPILWVLWIFNERIHWYILTHTSLTVFLTLQFSKMNPLCLISRQSPIWTNTESDILFCAHIKFQNYHQYWSNIRRYH